MSARWMGAAKKLRRAIVTGVPVAISAPPALSITPKFSLDQRVRWYEGRTRRPRSGVVHAIEPVPGWPHEYDVQHIKRDGTPGRICRKYESQLEAIHDEP